MNSRLLLTALTLCCTCATRAENMDDWDWPRVFKTDKYEIALYQPQIHEWTDFKHAVVRLAVGIEPKGGEKMFGAITGDFDTVYNNDHDNSAGMGVGKDLAYIETNEGRLVDGKGTTGQYVRLYSKGNTSNEMNHYIEVEVFGIPGGA